MVHEATILREKPVVAVVAVVAYYGFLSLIPASPTKLMVD
jgi:hypothetical protein